MRATEQFRGRRMGSVPAVCEMAGPPLPHGRPRRSTQTARAGSERTLVRCTDLCTLSRRPCRPPEPTEVAALRARVICGADPPVRAASPCSPLLLNATSTERRARVGAAPIRRPEGPPQRTALPHKSGPPHAIGLPYKDTANRESRGAKGRRGVTSPMSLSFAGAGVGQSWAVSGHGFSRAVKGPSTKGFNPRAVTMAVEIQGLKPFYYSRCSARLKSGPDTKVFTRGSRYHTQSVQSVRLSDIGVQCPPRENRRVSGRLAQVVEPRSGEAEATRRLKPAPRAPQFSGEGPAQVIACHSGEAEALRWLKPAPRNGSVVL